MQSYSLKLIRYYIDYIMYEHLPKWDNTALLFIIYCLRFNDRYKSELDDMLNVSKTLSFDQSIRWLVCSLSDNVNFGRFIALSVCLGLIIQETKVSPCVLIECLKSIDDFEKFSHHIQCFEPSQTNLSFILCVSCVILGYFTARYFYK